MAPEGKRRWRSPGSTASKCPKSSIWPCRSSALILLGVVAARRWQAGEQGLAWLNIFLVYFALPALIFLVVSAAPFEQLVNWPFVTATSSVTVLAFVTMVSLSRLLLGTDLKTAALQGTSGSYGNVGYMGLPLSVAFFGPEAAVPAALVFCFDCALQFVHDGLSRHAGARAGGGGALGRTWRCGSPGRWQRTPSSWRPLLGVIGSALAVPARRAPSAPSSTC